MVVFGQFIYEPEREPCYDQLDECNLSRVYVLLKGLAQIWAAGNPPYMKCKVYQNRNKLLETSCD